MVGRAWSWWAGVVLAVAGARELDPAACAARFDLQRDKIIRTEESREMGARYLSELDVGARTECRTLCCETDSCDVFVYEEKGPGSCYLFNCGPPEDFRCKFTAHSNFSSGVLALSRRLAELQDQEALAHHERELASLRSATPAPSSTSTTTTAVPPPPPPHEPPAPQPSSASFVSATSSRCSRYQFECRRGGECIAVYNACDGVAQCADASDEAPELGCPPAPALVPAPAPVAPSPRWPHRLAQAQPPPGPRYVPDAPPAPSSHIFSHKGGLLQETEPAPPQYPPFEPPPAPPAPWNRRLWTHQQNGAEIGGWSGGVGGYSRGEWAGEAGGEGRRAWPVPQPRPPDEYLPPALGHTMPEMPIVYSSQQQTLRDSPKKGLEVGPAPPQPPRTQPPPHTHPQPPDRREEQPPPPEATARAKQRQDKPEPAHTPASGSGAGGAGAAERHLAATRDEHDGLSEHPPAAVLLLVIGVCMTGAMGAMLGCRARAARRRLRRGKPFAHDADYLVNGMYL